MVQRHYVWAIRTPSTEAVNESVTGIQDGGGFDPLEWSLTLFSGTGQPEEDLLAIIDEVELHHGSFSAAPAASTIAVYGAYPTGRAQGL